MSSLFVRLSLVFLAILLTLGLSAAWIAHKNNQAYFLEFTQQLNRPVAMYLAENGNLVKDGKPNSEALKALAPHIMMINPSVDVYLLDLKGEVVGHVQADNTLTMTSVELEPVLSFLTGDSKRPVYGDNPKVLGGKHVFSAFPLISDSTIAETTNVGYVYVVLGSELHESLLSSLAKSYSTKQLVATLTIALLLALVSGVVLFFMLTKRLRKLTTNVQSMYQSLPRQELRLPNKNASGAVGLNGECDSLPLTSIGVGTPMPTAPLLDEIDTLSRSYQAMADQVIQQYTTLSEADQHRRELYAALSHDLRTPLTCMQGYIETLKLKQNELTMAERADYIDIAYHQGQKLEQLIRQLFELSTLHADGLVLSTERFSLLEIVHDVVQEFQLRAVEQQIELSVFPLNDELQYFAVEADIALIQRVLENVIENALRYTSSGGYVQICLLRKSQKVQVMITDNGAGMSTARVAELLEKDQHGLRVADKPGGSSNAGLGLSIIKRILALHSAELIISSVLGEGTCCQFQLSAPTLRPRLEKSHREISRLYKSRSRNQSSLSDSPSGLPAQSSVSSQANPVTDSPSSQIMLKLS